MMAPPARIAVTGAGPALHARLRRLAGPHGYAGREFRAYDYMRIRDAVRLYAALHETWDSAQLADDLACAGLAPEHEIRRLKRAFHRALVLALVAAPRPPVLVIESAEEFDQPGAAALLARAVRRAPRAVVTCVEADALPSDLTRADERELDAFFAGAALDAAGAPA